MTNPNQPAARNADDEERAQLQRKLRAAMTLRLLASAFALLVVTLSALWALGIIP